MNDRSLGVLENYDMEVIRTSKGRGTMICETNEGLRVLKEYKGRTEKLQLLEKLQQNIQPCLHTDRLVRNKEGELFSKDTDGTIYIVKEHIEGRECNYKSEEDVRQAFLAMAKMHTAMAGVTEEEGEELPIHTYVEEMTKHTRECKHIRNYLHRLKSRTEFERELVRHYDFFLEKAVEITGEAQAQDMTQYEELIRQGGFYYHGDYQYHNVLFAHNHICVINLERFGRDSGVRDIYLLFRKICEKTDWSVILGAKMLEAYQKERNLTPWEWKQLYYRLAYPDKFWKIVNFYYNSKKSWIPDKNMEKLEALVNQEKAKEKLLQTLFGER